MKNPELPCDRYNGFLKYTPPERFPDRFLDIAEGIHHYLATAEQEPHTVPYLARRAYDESRRADRLMSWVVVLSILVVGLFVSICMTMRIIGHKNSIIESLRDQGSAWSGTETSR